MKLKILTTRPEQTKTILDHAVARFKNWKPNLLYRSVAKAAGINIQPDAEYYEIPGGFRLEIVIPGERPNMPEKLKRALLEEIRKFDPKATIEVE